MNDLIHYTSYFTYTSLYTDIVPQWIVLPAYACNSYFVHTVVEVTFRFERKVANSLNGCVHRSDLWRAFFFLCDNFSISFFFVWWLIFSCHGEKLSKRGRLTYYEPSGWSSKSHERQKTIFYRNERYVCLTINNKNFINEFKFLFDYIFLKEVRKQTTNSV